MQDSKHAERQDNERQQEARELSKALAELRYARMSGDQLKIDLAENTLNSILDRYRCNT